MVVQIELITPLTKEECQTLIAHETEKDKREADTLVKVLEGHANELSFLRRKAAGIVLHNLTKVLMDKEKKEWVIANLKQKAEEGSEKMVSYDNGVLVLEFSEFDFIGADMLKRRGAGENNLRKRFKATSLKYIKDEVGEIKI